MAAASDAKRQALGGIAVAGDERSGHVDNAVGDCRVGVGVGRQAGAERWGIVAGCDRDSQRLRGAEGAVAGQHAEGFAGVGFERFNGGRVGHINIGAVAAVEVKRAVLARFAQVVTGQGSVHCGASDAKAQRGVVVSVAGRQSASDRAEAVVCRTVGHAQHRWCSQRGSVVGASDGQRDRGAARRSTVDGFCAIDVVSDDQGLTFGQVAEQRTVAIEGPGHRCADIGRVIQHGRCRVEGQQAHQVGLARGWAVRGAAGAHVGRQGHRIGQVAAGHGETARGAEVAAAGRQVHCIGTVTEGRRIHRGDHRNLEAGLLGQHTVTDIEGEFFAGIGRQRIDGGVIGLIGERPRAAVEVQRAVDAHHLAVEAGAVGIGIGNITHDAVGQRAATVTVDTVQGATHRRKIFGGA